MNILQLSRSFLLEKIDAFSNTRPELNKQLLDMS
jgi:hypothetical protein